MQSTRMAIYAIAFIALGIGLFICYKGNCLLGFPVLWVPLGIFTWFSIKKIDATRDAVRSAQGSVPSGEEIKKYRENNPSASIADAIEALSQDGSGAQP